MDIFWNYTIESIEALEVPVCPSYGERELIMMMMMMMMMVMVMVVTMMMMNLTIAMMKTPEVNKLH